VTVADVTTADAQLVERSLAGDGDAFGALYDRYFPAIYDFTYRMTRSGEEAADLAQDTFVQAMEKLPQLQAGASFKGWVFSIAHHAALRRIQRRQRFESSAPARANGGEEPSDPLLRQADTDRAASPEEAAVAADMAGLVWQAAASLEPRQYALLDMNVRQGLSSTEIAGVLGVTKGHASTMLNRMRSAVEGAIGAFLLAKQGSRECDTLGVIVASAEIPPVSPALQRTIDRHARRCEICSGTRRRVLSPVEMFGALAIVPAPPGLQGEVWAGVQSGSMAGPAGGGAPLASGSDAGLPPALPPVAYASNDWWTPGSRRLALIASVATAALIAAILIAVFALRSGSDDDGSLAGPASSATPTSASATAGAPGRVTRTPQPASSTAMTPPRTTPAPGTMVTDPTTPQAPGSPAATPTTDESPTTIPSTPDTAGPVIDGPFAIGPATLATEDTDACAPGIVRTKEVVAGISDASGVRHAFLFFQAPGDSERMIRMDEGAPFSAVLGPFTTPGGQLTFRVEAQDFAGNTTISATMVLALVACVA
jgi:RNA polymerase sigma factor (sigma-70 family)